jgi:hypothetical protein
MRKGVKTKMGVSGGTPGYGGGKGGTDKKLEEFFIP